MRLRCRYLQYFRLHRLYCLSLVALSLGMLGCASLPPAPQPGLKTLVGGAGGAVTGGLLASQLSHGNAVLTAAGVIGGLLAGAGVGSLLDGHDRLTFTKAVQQAPTAPADSITQWSDPQTGTKGDLEWQTWEEFQGKACRRYRLSAMTQGQTTVLTGCAVQRADGVWELRPEKGVSQ